jgi:multidrug efflux pump subunit AcrA (membrane-fusion protein)
MTVTLSASGTVEAPEQLALSFAGTGRLLAVGVREGERVAMGTVVARLDPGPALVGLRTAVANLAAARAQLVQLRDGLPRIERFQLRVTLLQARQILSSAERSVTDARVSAVNEGTRFQTELDQAKRQLADDLARLDAAQTGLATDQISSDGADTRVASDRKVLAADGATLLAGQKQQIDDQQLSAPEAVLAADEKAILDSQAAVASDESKLGDDTDAATGAHALVQSDQNHIAAVQSAIETDRETVTVATNAQSAGGAAARQSVHAAQAAVASARLGILATAATNAVHAERPGAGALAAARAAVEVAQAAVATAAQSVRDTRLIAPFSGTIAAVDGVTGQLVGNGSAGLVTLVNLDRLTVRASFEPMASALLSPGQKVTVTVPGLSGAELTGRIASVDTLAGPRSAYSATVELTNPPAALRPGMAADVKVSVTPKARA